MLKRAIKTDSVRFERGFQAKECLSAIKTDSIRVERGFQVKGRFKSTQANGVTPREMSHRENSSEGIPKTRPRPTQHHNQQNTSLTPIVYQYRHEHQDALRKTRAYHNFQQQPKLTPQLARPSTRHHNQQHPHDHTTTNYTNIDLTNTTPHHQHLQQHQPYQTKTTTINTTTTT